MTVKLSRSEIKSGVEKAIRGIGFDWGRAIDGGVMASWLAAHDQVFLGNLLHSLDQMKANQHDEIVFAPADAMVLIEYVLATDQDWSGHVTGLRFMIAAMGIVSKEQNALIKLDDEKRMIAYADHGEVWVNAEFEAGDRLVTLSKNHSHDYSQHDEGQPLQKLNWSEQTAHEASLSCWQRLEVYAFKVYVKETEEKRRSGAGAGDIDNS